MKRQACLLMGFLLLLPILLTALPALSPSGRAAAPQGAALPEMISLRLEAPAYRLVYDLSGFDQLVVDGYDYLSTPGDPALPARLVHVALPPDVDWASLRVNFSRAGSVDLPGRYNLLPAAAPVTCGATAPDCGLTLSAAPSAPRGASYQQDAYFPAAFATPLGHSQLRTWRYLTLVFTPFQYNPVSGQLRRVTQLDVQITFERLPQARTYDAGFDEARGEFLANFEQARGWYLPAGAPQTQAAAAGYVILTTNSIRDGSSKLAAFIAHKQSRGHTVEVVTEDQWGGLTGQAPNGAAEKIRQWLAANYLEKGIHYLLLVGNPDPDDPQLNDDPVGDVPMKMTWPRRGKGSDEASPTDYFYADLTGNWDLDGDGFFGEYSDDSGTGGIDRAAELYVGRIPVYRSEPGWAATLDAILQKIITYETSTDLAWRKTALLPMSFLDATTDGADLGQAMTGDYLNLAGISAYTLYQRRFQYCFSSYTPNQNLVDGAVKGRWQANDYGLVAWWSHGNDSAALVGYGDTCADGNLLSSSDTSVLDDAHPAIVYQNSCRNGMPETSASLAYRLLQQGAVATFAASRVSWYAAGPWLPSRFLADNASLGYYVMAQVSSGETVGKSFYTEKGSMGPGWGAESWMNLVDFNLYGDPATNLYGATSLPAAPGPLTATPVSQTQIDLAWVDNSSDETGFKLERSPNGVSGWAGIATLGANVTTYTNTGLTCDSPYYYRVRAFNAGGFSPYSPVAPAVTSACTAGTCRPAATIACGGVSSRSNTGGGSTRQVDMYACSDWYESGPEYTYAFTPDITGVVTATLTNLTADLDIFALDSLDGPCSGENCLGYGSERVRFPVQAGHKYYLVVDGFFGAIGNYTLSVKCKQAEPAAPSGLAANAVSSTQIDLTWTDNSNDETQFKLERSPTGADNWVQIAALNANTTTYSDKNLTCNKSYYYRLRASNGGGSSAYSGMANARTGPCAPAAPGGLAATAVSPSRIDLTWTDSSDTEAGFRLERSLTGSDTWTLVATLPPDTTGYVDMGLTPHTRYYYRIRAFNDGGDSAYSNMVAAETPDGPPELRIFLPVVIRIQ